MYLSDECLVRTLCPIPELRNKQLQSSLSPARQRTFTLSSFLSFYGSGIASFKNDKMMGTDCYLIEVLICIFYWWVAQHIGCLIFLFWSWSVPVFFSYFLMIYCIVITCMCVLLFVFLCLCRYLQRLGKGVRCLEAGVICHYEPPDLGPENRTQICRNSKC